MKLAMIYKACLKLRRAFLTVVLWLTLVQVVNYCLFSSPITQNEVEKTVVLSRRDEVSEMDPISDCRSIGIPAVDDLVADLTANNRSLLVQFSSWDYSEEKVHVHETILQLWNMWTPLIKNIVFSNDDSVKKEALMYNWHVGPVNHILDKCYGPPAVKYLYLDSFSMLDSIFYGYTNSDIAFGNGLLDTLLFLATLEKWKTRPLMIVGRRTNFNFSDAIWFDVPEQIQENLKNGTLVIRSSDFFFTNKAFPWDKMGNFTVGRPLIVRALLGFAVLHNIDIIDTTLTVSAIHLTTADGIKSSYSSTGMECNEDLLLAKEFSDIPLDMGHCECASLETFYDSEGRIQLREREPDWLLCNRTRVPFANFPTCLLKCVERGFKPVKKNKPHGPSVVQKMNENSLKQSIRTTPLGNDTASEFVKSIKTYNKAKYAEQGGENVKTSNDLPKYDKMKRQKKT